ncbi:hypothetical protein MTO96_016099 [Rhipicephalus appendiculatus]
MNGKDGGRVKGWYKKPELKFTARWERRFLCERGKPRTQVTLAGRTAHSRAFGYRMAQVHFLSLFARWMKPADEFGPGLEVSTPLLLATTTVLKRMHETENGPKGYIYTPLNTRGKE